LNKLSFPDRICSTFESHEGGIIKGTFEFEASLKLENSRQNSCIYWRDGEFFVSFILTGD
jgi:hypothetical protein